MSEIALIAGEHGGAYGQAYGLFNVAFSGGFLVGPLWGGYVTERAGWGVMVGSLAGLAGVSVILSGQEDGLVGGICEVILLPHLDVEHGPLSRDLDNLADIIGSVRDISDIIETLSGDSDVIISMHGKFLRRTFPHL